MLALLTTFSWQELRHHPWRNAAAAVAVMLGVALALAVHLINSSALDEFSQAVRSVNGQPDLEVRSANGRFFEEAVFALITNQPLVAVASPVVEAAVVVVLEVPVVVPNAGGPTLPGSTADKAAAAASSSPITPALTSSTAPGPAGRRVALRIIGADALVMPAMAPGLVPRPAAAADRMALFQPGNLFLNATALQNLGLDGSALATVAVQATAASKLATDTATTPTATATATVAGSVTAGGAPLAVMDIGAAQDLLGLGGQLSRIDIRLQPGADRAAWMRNLQALPGWPEGVAVAEPADAVQRIGNLSRAYRVNLTVLALVALFTGAFLVFSVLALSVSKRAHQLALLAVLGLTPRQRLQLVLIESVLLGAVGSMAGIALGSALAAVALRVLGGDLGGGYFQGVAPRLQWSSGAALAYGCLGTAAAAVGGWWPARAAARLPPAQTLKGLGSFAPAAGMRWLGMALMVAGALLALAPPIGGMPLAAYVSVALLLVGGITALPWLIALVYDRLAPLVAKRLLPLLAVERARRMRETAAVAVSGVVASLSLAVALTVMVASFRQSVTDWLDTVLPAQLYVRLNQDAGGAAASRGGSGTNIGNSAGNPLYFPAGFAAQVGQLSGVQRASGLRNSDLQLDPTRPAVVLIARDLFNEPARALPLTSAPLPVPPGNIGIYVSEAMVDLYGASPGTAFAPINASFKAFEQPDRRQAAMFFVAGVWRDYARQFGAVVLDSADFVRLTGDAQVNDLALWLDPGTDPVRVEAEVRQLASAAAAAAAAAAATSSTPVVSGWANALEFAPTGQIRATSLRIFDRSFAVTYWLQGVAIAIGLFGIAASFSAQVLARRKEFGLLVHLGFTRQQILRVVAGEGAAWTTMGAVAGLLLGMAVSVVLVHVVNPQSFHWTMDLQVPWLRLAALCSAVVAAGTLTAWLAGRAAAGHDAVLAVKEDW